MGLVARMWGLWALVALMPMTLREVAFGCTVSPTKWCSARPIIFLSSKLPNRIASGCVPRLSLEQWLHTECRPTLALLDGATLMDLLDRHTYGERKQGGGGTLLDEATLMNVLDRHA